MLDKLSNKEVYSSPPNSDMLLTGKCKAGDRMQHFQQGEFTEIRGGSPHHHQTDIVSKVEHRFILPVTSSESSYRPLPVSQLPASPTRIPTSFRAAAEAPRQGLPDKRCLVSVTESIAFLPEARACDSLSSRVISSALIVEIRQTFPVFIDTETFLIISILCLYVGFQESLK